MAHSRRAACAAGLALALVVGGTTPAFASPPEPISIHRYELEQHRGERLAERVLPKTLPEPKGQSLARVVYGYYPFWVADLSTIRWSALTHLAWFSVDMNSLGEVDALNGWPDPEVVAVAHAADVRVDLTFTLFGNSSIQALCNSADRRQTAIDNMVSLMEQGGADGISVDFEFVNAATRAAFVTFIQELRAELDARGHADAQISIAGPAVDWAEAIDLETLLDYADWYFVMGYGYFWSGSSKAGPTGMLRVTEDWAAAQSQSSLRSIAYYSRIIGADKRAQVIWGVPYYGREWVTNSPNFGANVIDQLGAVTYSGARSDIAAGGVEELYHQGIENPWYRWQAGGNWRQVYYDDERSLAAKYDLAIAQDLGGVGMWALNYDKPHAELWDVLEDKFTTLPAEHPEGHRHNPIPVPLDALPFHDERNTADGPSHYFNYYACDPSTPEYGREWVYALDVCQPGTIQAAVPEYPDRDPDLALLSAPDQEACLERVHTELAVDVEPGRYLLVVDTYVDTPVELEGPYELDVDFVPAPGTEGCAPHLACSAGDCVCPNPGHLDCDESCVDPSSSNAHCGACDNPCAAAEVCVMGQCQPESEGPGGSGGDGGAPPNAEADASGEVAVGCSCATSPRPTTAGWLALGAAAAALARRAPRARDRRRAQPPPTR